MVKICRLIEEDTNGSGPLIPSKGFSVGCNCWIIFLLIITMDLDCSRRSSLHPIVWDQRYFLILLFISIYHLSLCKSDYSRRSFAVSKWLRSILFLDYVILCISRSKFIHLMHRNRQAENCYLPMRSCCCCYANPCWAILFRCSKFVSGTLFISCVYLNFT